MLPGLRARPLVKTPPSERTFGALGQCRLTKSGTSLLLSRYQGCALTIAGIAHIVPAAGVTLEPTGLVAGNRYYIYACMGALGMMLEASATGHATDNITGVEIKAGDPTRTLVGMAQPVAGPAWIDVVNQRQVISWFNRRPIATTAAFTAARTVAAGGAYAEVNIEIRNAFLTWGDTVSMSFDGSVSNTAINGNTNTAIGLDGVVSLFDGWSRFQAYANSAVGPVSLTAYATPAEGFHYTTVAGSSTVGSGGWELLANAGGNRCTLKGVIQG